MTNQRTLYGLLIYHDIIYMIYQLQWCLHWHCTIVFDYSQDTCVIYRLSHGNFISHPILARGRCISVWVPLGSRANIQRPSCLYIPSWRRRTIWRHTGRSELNGAYRTRHNNRWLTERDGDKCTLGCDINIAMLWFLYHILI